jgi:hypothetical protein
MTLIAAATGSESLWLVADRRLFYENREPRDDARKVMFLETTDGVAILGYAGLGSTRQGTEPADWMSAVLRGRNLPLEASLGLLGEAMKRQMPRHVRDIPVGPAAHNVVVPAFLGKQPKLYTIDLVFAADRKSYRFRITRHVVGEPRADSRTPRLAIAGSGARYLMRHQDWRRDLLRLIQAYDRGRVSERVVADHLAALSGQVHRDTKDGTVGPTCVVAWRHRKSGLHKGGGGHQFYSATKKEPITGPLPTIANGFDVAAIVNVLMPAMLEKTKALARGGDLQVNWEELDAGVARLPDKPDEDLR